MFRRLFSSSSPLASNLKKNNKPSIAPMLDQIGRNNRPRTPSDQDEDLEGISKFTAVFASGIVLLGLFGNFLFSSIFDDIFPDLSRGIGLGEFRKAKDVIEFPRALYEKLKSAEHEELAMKGKLGDAIDITILRTVIEVASNVFAGFVTFKYGHTCPIVFGCFSGLIATIGLVFSSRMRWLLVVTTILHAASSGHLVVGGLSLLVRFFETPASRQRATTTLHLLSTIAYCLAPLSTVGMALWGPWTAIVLIACLLLASILLFNLFFPPSQPFGGKLISIGTYAKRAFLNAQVLVTLLCAFVIAFALSILMAKSTSFFLEMPDSDRTDRKVALVVYGGFAVQLFFQLLAGVLCVRLVARPGISLIVALFVAGLVFMTYPKVLEENYWLILAVQLAARACLGVATIVIVPVLARLVANQIRRKDGAISIANNHGIIVGIYLAVYHLGFTLGPICFHLMASVRSVMIAYTAIGAMLLAASPLALIIVGRCLCTGPSPSGRRFSFVANDDNLQQPEWASRQVSRASPTSTDDNESQSSGDTDSDANSVAVHQVTVNETTHLLPKRETDLRPV